MYIQTHHRPAGADGPPTLSQARQQSTPHIKTYLRYNAADPDDLQWLLLTSCNLSKAAWGEACALLRCWAALCGTNLGHFVAHVPHLCQTATKGRTEARMQCCVVWDGKPMLQVG